MKFGENLLPKVIQIQQNYAKRSSHIDIQDDVARLIAKNYNISLDFSVRRIRCRRASVYSAPGFCLSATLCEQHDNEVRLKFSPREYVELAEDIIDEKILDIDGLLRLLRN